MMYSVEPYDVDSFIGTVQGNVCTHWAQGVACGRLSLSSLMILVCRQPLLNSYATVLPGFQ